MYLTAFSKGYLPETLLYDVETDFETAEGKDYQPQNYDGKFHGPLPMKKALGGSLNIPAVKTLYLVGVNDAIAIAKNLGISSLNDPNRLGLSLVLGGGEVKLIDHVGAYSAIATGGIKHPQTAILSIEDAKGSILEQYQENPGERVLDEKYVAMLDSVLSLSLIHIYTVKFSICTRGRKRRFQSRFMALGESRSRSGFCGLKKRINKAKTGVIDTLVIAQIVRLLKRENNVRWADNKKYSKAERRGL